MIKIPNLKDLPNKEELEFKEKAFLIDVYDLVRQTSKKWFYALAVAVVLSIPFGIVFHRQMTAFFIERLPRLQVNSNVLDPKDLRAVQVNFLPVGRSGLFSVYAHVANPNADLSARSFQYEFTFKNQSGAILKTIAGSDFLLRGASRFVVVPAVELSEDPATVEFAVKKANWTGAPIDFKPQFDILQREWGDSDGKFFVEAIVKNPHSFSIKKVQVPIMIFGSDNKTVLAVNKTVLDDIKPFESRYFRVFWPVPGQELFSPAALQVEILAEVNPLDPDLR